jgi:ParB-like chromosome segregation protein Spo0J
MILRKIQIDEINLEDRRFRFTCGQPDEKFLRSIKEISVVEPVKIIKREASLVLVSGWKRVEGAISCGLEELPVLEIPENLSDLETFALAFFENYSHHQFSLAEKSLAVRRFSDFGLGQTELISRILRILELPPTRHTLEVLLDLSRQGKALPIIHLKDWKLITAELFLSFPEEERFLLLSLFSDLSQNKQKEMIELFYSLKKRKGKNLKAIVEEPAIASCLEIFKKNKPEAADKLLSILRKEVSPLVHRLCEEIDREIRQFKLPNNVRLDYDRTLEKSNLTLEVMVSSQEELRETVTEILNSLADGNWQRLFELLQQEIEE